jgi:hypothetical protein
LPQCLSKLTVDHAPQTTNNPLTIAMVQVVSSVWLLKIRDCKVDRRSRLPLTLPPTCLHRATPPPILPSYSPLIHGWVRICPRGMCTQRDGVQTGRRSSSIASHPLSFVVSHCAQRGEFRRRLRPSRGDVPLENPLA